MWQGVDCIHMAKDRGRWQDVVKGTFRLTLLTSLKLAASQEGFRSLDVIRQTYVGHLESKERLRIQPAQLFNFS